MASIYDENGSKRYLDLEGLAYYDEKIKAYVDAAQTEADGAAAQALVDAKAYTDSKIGTLGEGLTTVAAAIAAEATRASGVEGTLASLTTESKGNLVVAINEVDSHADQAQSEVDALEALVGTGYGTKTVGEGESAQTVNLTVKEYIDNKTSGLDSELAAVAKSGKASDVSIEDSANIITATTVEGALQEIKAAVDILNGDADTTGSVAKQVNDAVVDLVDGAPDALNTLKEIADWIANQDDNGVIDAATLVSRVDANTSAIGVASKAAVGNVGDADYQPAVVATGLNKKIEDVAANASSALDSKIEALDAEKTQAQTATQALSLHIKEVDGVITEFSGDINTVSTTDIDALFVVGD